MIKPIYKTKFALPFIAAATLMISSCQYNNQKKLHDYMAEKGCTQYELDNMLDATKRSDRAKESVARQSAVDSMAYRDLFNTTPFANDSAAISELNKIAAKASIEKYATANWEGLRPSANHIYDIAVADNIDVKEADKLKNLLLGSLARFKDIYALYSKLQSYSDMYFYGKFFVNKGLFNDSVFAGKYLKVSEYLE